MYSLLKESLSVMGSFMPEARFVQALLQQTSFTGGSDGYGHSMSGLQVAASRRSRLTIILFNSQRHHRLQIDVIWGKNCNHLSFSFSKC